MMREVVKLEEGCYYHIYNRGINGEQIFKASRDYTLFVKTFEEYSKDALDVFTYCLLSNHFHSLIFTKEDVIVPRNDGKGDIKLVASKQLGHFFNSYAQTFNHEHDRTGSLFEKPFKRKAVELNDYLRTVVMYTHTNPCHHGFLNDYRQWPYSSYHDLIGNEPTFLKRDVVMSWFGGRENFIKSHLEYPYKETEGNWMIEY